MATDSDGNTGVVLALVGMGTALAWWIWRGRGAGTARGQRDSRAGTRVKVWIGSGDRVKIDGVPVDLATAVDRVRRAGTADVVVAGDAREGWFEQVRDALLATGATLY
jgi:hypothetical protein